METRDAIRSVVENIPGICQLKPEQEECLVHILNGGDVVALLPTGFGKSLIYQLLPIVREKLRGYLGISVSFICRARIGTLLTGQRLLSFPVLEYCHVML